MPAHFKFLLEMVIALDSLLKFFKERSKITAFDALKNSVQATTQKTFDLADFKKILAVDDSLYTCEWDKSRESKDYFLRISPTVELTKASLKQRKENFRFNLFELINQAHTFWCSSHQIDHDPVLMRTWHNSFDPNDKTIVKDIVPSGLQQIPKPKRSESVTNFLKRHNVDTASKNSF